MPANGRFYTAIGAVVIGSAAMDAQLAFGGPIENALVAAERVFFEIGSGQPTPQLYVSLVQETVKILRAEQEKGLTDTTQSASVEDGKNNPE